MKENQATFRVLLLTKCQTEFESDKAIVFEDPEKKKKELAAELPDGVLYLFFLSRMLKSHRVILLHILEESDSEFKRETFFFLPRLDQKIRRLHFNDKKIFFKDLNLL